MVDLRFGCINLRGVGQAVKAGLSCPTHLGIENYFYAHPTCFKVLEYELTTIN